MRAAITTKYLGATDHNGSRILAKCKAGRLTEPYDTELTDEQNHRNAAALLLTKMGWDFPVYELVGGEIDGLTMVYCLGRAMGKPVPSSTPELQTGQGFNLMELGWRFVQLECGHFLGGSGHGLVTDKEPTLRSAIHSAVTTELTSKQEISK